MKKTIAVIGSAAALSFAGAGLAAAQSDLPVPGAGSSGTATETDDTTADETTTDDTTADDAEGTEEVSKLAEQVCGAVTTFDVLGSVGAIAPGLEGDECAVTADQALALAQKGDIAGAVDLLRGVKADSATTEGGGADKGTTGTETATGA